MSSAARRAKLTCSYWSPDDRACAQQTSCGAAAPKEGAQGCPLRCVPPQALQLGYCIESGVNGSIGIERLEIASVFGRLCTILT